MDEKKFRERLKRIRKRKGINQVVLSELLGMSRNVINQYECGERLPSFKALIALADFFDVSLDYLCGRVDY